MNKLSPKVSELPSKPPLNITDSSLVIREFNEKTDRQAVENMERLCEFGSRGKPSLVTDLMGDPICRIRHSPPYVMMVAEYGEEEKEIVGVIRGCVKTVTRGKKNMNEFPKYVKVAYVLGLRVSPSHRRLGLGTKLVQKLEQWCVNKGAQYTYMATDCGNEASINLFTQKCAYNKFRTPTVLVQPVHAHKKPLSSKIAVIQLTPKLAESIYLRVFANSEFFPKDINVILTNKLNLGTFMAVPKKFLPKWDPQTGLLPPKFAILSVWNTKEVFKMQFRGVPRLTYAGCVGTRVADKLLPWLRIPSIPNVFKPFGVYMLYGLYMDGSGASRLMKGMCDFVHNLAKDDHGCGAVVAELGRWDPVVEGVPHWRRFSWEEDVWCMKKLRDMEDDGEDWIRSQPSTSVIFVDPREF